MFIMIVSSTFLGLIIMEQLTEVQQFSKIAGLLKTTILKSFKQIERWQSLLVMKC